MALADAALECGSLLPLLLRPACWPGLGNLMSASKLAPGESGSKLPHSKAGLKPRASGT